MTERSGPGVGPDYLVAGRYRLQAKLGGGGMGAVWLAHDKLLDRDVAIKRVASTAGMSPEKAAEVRNRTIREGRIAASLSHHHAIAMYDVAVESGEPWLVMEYLSSRSLAQALNIMDTLPPFEVAQIGAQVADALADAHAAGIVHRDIKPGNILIADRGRHVGTVKISDFGISLAKGDHDERSDVITGTPAYFAPEVARGADPTSASDVFSLGATLYTAVEGQPPFGFNEDSATFLQRVATGEIIPPQLSGPIADALLHMLEPDPARRPTMAQARDELVTITVGKGGNAAYILGAPIRSAEGTVPDWAQRNVSFTARRPNRPQTPPSSSRTSHPPMTPRPRPEPPRPPAKPPVASKPKKAAAQSKSQTAPLLIAMVLLVAVIAGIAAAVVLIF